MATSSPMNDLLQKRVKKLEKRIEDLENSAESNGQITEITDSINKDLESLLDSKISDEEFLKKIENEINARTVIEVVRDISGGSNVEERILRLFRGINRNPSYIEEERFLLTNEERARNPVTFLLDQLDNFIVTNYGYYPSSAFEIRHGSGHIPSDLLDEETIKQLDRIKGFARPLPREYSNRLRDGLINELNKKIRELSPREKETFLIKLVELRGRLYKLEAKMASKIIQSFFLFYQIREREMNIRLKLIPESSETYRLKETIEKIKKIILKIKESLKTIYNITESADINNIESFIKKQELLAAISSFLNGVVGSQLVRTLRNLENEYRCVMDSLGSNKPDESCNTKLDGIEGKIELYKNSAYKPIKDIAASPQEFRIDFDRDFPNRQNKDKDEAEDKDKYPDDKYAIGGDPNS